MRNQGSWELYQVADKRLRGRLRPAVIHPADRKGGEAGSSCESGARTLSSGLSLKV